MENNETNQNLALQVLAIVSQGSMLQTIENPNPIAVGYAEMWLDRDMMFFCEMDGSETGKQHVLRFASFQPLSNQVTFFDEKGKMIAGLAPFNEWPEVNATDMQEMWHEWIGNKEAIEGCKQIGREWRHAELG